MRPAGLFDLPDRLAQLSKTGESLEVLNRVVGFEHTKPMFAATRGGWSFSSRHRTLNL